jgi:hypothetical protein
MTIWFSEGRWFDDAVPPEHKIIQERKIQSWKILEHVLPNSSNSIMYEILLDCNHKIIQVVPNNGIPKGLYRICDKCRI